MADLHESAKAAYAPQGDRGYTYADYASWDDDKRWELIDGVAYAMSAPVTAHQAISGELFLQISSFLKGKPCRVFAAPYDIRLNADETDDTVVQPDITVICDRAKIDEKGCKGAPDLVIEILSPSSARHDRLRKFHAYRKAGVPEYLIVDPDTRMAEACVMVDGHYSMARYDDTDLVPLHTLPGLSLSLPEAFAEMDR